MKRVVYLCFEWEVGWETSCGSFPPEWYGDSMIHVLIHICSTKMIWGGLVFLLLLCFITAKLKSGGIDYFNVWNMDSCDQWKPVFCYRRCLKNTGPEDVQAVFLPASGGTGEGKEKRQRLHKLLMDPYSWNLLSLLSGCTNSCEACDSCWAVLCGSWDTVFFFSRSGCHFLSLMFM